MTEVLAVDDAELASAATRAAGVLKAGGLVVAPAGGMYGVFADVSQEAATQRLHAARGTDATTPLPVLVHNPRRLLTIVREVPETAERIMASYWPGPVSLVLQMLDRLGWSVGESNGYVALRMPAEPVALMMIANAGPLACTAAATPGAAPPADVAAAQSELGDAVDLYLDAGPRPGTRSTVVDVTHGRVEVLREGEVPAEHVLQVANGLVEPGQRPEPGG